jgi:hypothetical protein
MQPAPERDIEGDNELASLQAGFPKFQIWREITCDRIRYIARSLHLGLNPHTVITADPDELRAALSDAPARPHSAGHEAERA